MVADVHVVFKHVMFPSFFLGFLLDPILILQYIALYCNMLRITAHSDESLLYSDHEKNPSSFSGWDAHVGMFPAPISWNMFTHGYRITHSWYPGFVVIRWRHVGRCGKPYWFRSKGSIKFLKFCICELKVYIKDIQEGTCCSTSPSLKFAGSVASGATSLCQA